jgi:putative membrane protein
MKKKITFYDKIEEDLILRDHLAIERTRLANETTLLAYLRTGLFLISVGLTFIKIEEFKGIAVIGWICIPLSFIFIVFGIFRFIRLNAQIKKLYKKQV